MSRHNALDAMVLILGLGSLLAWQLVTPPVWHHGEAREGLVVQDIVQNGHWILPRRNGELPSKPPFFHWQAAVAMRLFGSSDAMLRLPSAVAALATALATYVLGVELGGLLTGRLAVGALLGMVPFWVSAGEARVDMVFAAAITVALAGFYVWDRHGMPWARALCYAGGAAAVLAKGPAGAAIPVLVVVTFLAADGRLERLRELFDLRWLLAALVADVAWYALAAADGGSAFLHLQLFHENIERFVGSDAFHRSGRGASGRMIVVLLASLLPWSLALLASAVRRWRGTRLAVGERFVHAWWLVVLALFTVAAGKRAVYILPACPAVALVAGWTLARLVEERAPLGGNARTVVAPRSAAKLMVLALLLFDLAAVVALQTVRAKHARRASLSGFAETVQSTVPAGAPLFAAEGLQRNELLVLAYRTRRPIPRQDAGLVAGAYYLVPDADTGAPEWSDATVLAKSARRRGPNVALMLAR